MDICWPSHLTSITYFMATQDDKDPLNLLGLNKLFDGFVDQYTKLTLPE
jgi:choline kinase